MSSPAVLQSLYHGHTAVLQYVDADHNNQTDLLLVLGILSVHTDGMDEKVTWRIPVRLPVARSEKSGQKKKARTLADFQPYSIILPRFRH
jgi:alpha-D-ribose 1-methylphosphonate 5-triphosphate diphosphatase PhnM